MVEEAPPDAFSKLPDVFCVLDEARVTFDSSSAADVSGIAPERFHGRLAFDLVHPDDRARVVQLAEHGWQGSFTESVRVQDADGGWTWRFVSGVRTVDAAGHASAVLVLRKISKPETETPEPG